MSMEIPSAVLRSHDSLTARVSFSALSNIKNRRDGLRLLFVTPRFFPLMGGVESHVYEVARRMAQQNVTVTVLTTDPTGDLEPSETIEDVEVVRVRAYPANRDYYYAPHIYDRMIKGTWDLVHLQSYHTLVAPLAMYAAHRAHTPYVVTFHGGGHSSTIRNRGRSLQQRFLRPLLARAERLVTLAEFEKTFFKTQLQLPDEKFVTIPNGCDLPQLPAAERPPTDPDLIISIGRLERYKGHQRVIAAMPYLLKQRPDARLWVLGTGPYESELKEQVEALGLSTRVRIEGIPPEKRNQMARELSRAGLVVLLSDFETHPIGILEALSLQRPVLLAETSGLRELVEHEYGRGISLASTPPQVAAAMFEQLTMPRAPKEIQLPTWDDCTTNLLDLYGSVLRRCECAF